MCNEFAGTWHVAHEILVKDGIRHLILENLKVQHLVM